MKRFIKAKGITSIEKSYRKVLVEDYVRDYVEVERFLECCKACPNYNNKWSCPPFNFNVVDKYWNQYKYLHLFAFKMNLDKSLVGEGISSEDIDALVMRIRHQNYTMASRWILDVEKQNPGSFALDGGHCAKCKRCTRPKGNPCRYGDSIRPAIDAIGGNLVKTAEEIFETKIFWIENGKVPEYFLFIVGLLSNSGDIEVEI